MSASDSALLHRGPIKLRTVLMRHWGVGLLTAGLGVFGLSAIATPPAQGLTLQSPRQLEVSTKKKPTVKLRSATTSGATGQKIILTGRAKGSKKKTLVIFQQRFNGGKWNTASKARIKSKGKFRTSYTLPDSASQLSLRAKVKKFRSSRAVTILVSSPNSRPDPTTAIPPAPIPAQPAQPAQPASPSAPSTARVQYINWPQNLNSDLPAVGETVSLAATSTSGKPVSYRSSNPTIATVTGTQLTFTGKGTATVTANVLGDSVWKSAQTSQTVSVAATLVRGAGSALQDAVENASDGETLKLNGSFDLTEFDRSVDWVTGNAGLIVDKNLTLFGGAITQTKRDSAIAVKQGVRLALAGGIVISGTDIEFRSGAGIYNLGTVLLSDGTISDGKAGAGGGIFNDGGTVTLSGGKIINNSATSGGGIFNDGGRIELVSGTITANGATNFGGIYDPTGTVLDPNGLVTGNIGGEIGR